MHVVNHIIHNANSCMHVCHTLLSFVGFMGFCHFVILTSKINDFFLLSLKNIGIIICVYSLITCVVYSNNCCALVFGHYYCMYCMTAFLEVGFTFSSV